MLVLTLCGVFYVILAKGLLVKHFPKNAAFQFIVNPSTVFFISGMIVAKYRDSPTAISDNLKMGNSSIGTSNRFLGKSETLLKDSSFLGLQNLELRLISQIIQNYDNSTKWQLKFVDLPRSTINDVAASYMLPMTSNPDQLPNQLNRIANVLITDSMERVPIWAVVDLITMKVMSWSRGKFGVADKPISDGDLRLAGEIALTDGNVTEMIRDVIRDHGEIEDIIPDAWDAGFVTKNFQDRMVQVYLFSIRRNEGKSFASPLNFVVYVHLGSRNVVESIETLPLQQTSITTNTIMHDMFSFWTPSIMSGTLSPNSVRSELYKLKGVHPMSQASHNSFMVSTSEELQR